MYTRKVQNYFDWFTSLFKVTKLLPIFLQNKPHTYWMTTASSIVEECWHRVREVPGLIPSRQGPRHTKDVIKMVPVVPLFSTEH